MTKFKFVSLGLLALGACSASQQAQINNALSSPPGKLFCAIQTQGGGQIIAGIIDATATVALPGAAPASVLVTNMGQDFVNQACAKAAAAAGGVAGVPVSPPATGTVVPDVAIVPPAKTTNN